MSQKAFIIILLLGLVAGPLMARPAGVEQLNSEATRFNPIPVKAIAPEMEAVNSSNQADRKVDTPRRDEPIEPLGNVAIGDDFIVGYTYYDYQHNGSNAKMIARDSYGGVQFLWMKGYTVEIAGERHIVYNYLNSPIREEGELLEDPGNASPVDNADKSGYGALGVLPTGRQDPADCDLGVAYYHAMGYQGAPDAAYTSTTQSVDFGRGFGAFDPSYLPSWPNVQLIWPKGAIDRQNKSHVFACEYPGADGDQNWHRLGYWNGQPDADFYAWAWPEVPINVDTTMVISQVVATSTTSDRVALGWHHSRLGIPVEPWIANGGAAQRNSDIRYIISENGEDWDWDDGIESITNIFPIRPELWDANRDLAYGDTFRPYCDLDLQFDPWGEDELYATFATCVFKEYPEVDANNFIAGIPRDGGPLWFWSSREDTLTMIYDGWYWNRTDNGGTWRSRCGGWRLNADRPSIAFNPDNAGTIYVVWCNFAKFQELNAAGDGFDVIDEEMARDTSGAGFSNAEMMVSISDDWGITWREPINITETRWDGDVAPDAGECKSENWHSVAYVADDTLHIQYILDLDAGGIAQEEGEATNDPVIYHRVALADLDHDRDPVEMPREDFMFHNYLRPVPANIDRDPGVPTPNEEVFVTADVLVLGGQEIRSVELVYYLNENTNQEFSVDMEYINGDLFEGIIPGQANGTRVWYKIRATNEQGVSGLGPAGWYGSYIVREDGELTIHDVQYRPANWNVDYSPYVGYTVTVTGILTTPNSYNELYGAHAIQDGNGEYSGVFVRNIPDDLERGDILQVTGTVMESDPDDPDNWEYATYIDVSDYEILGADEPIVAERVNLRDLIYSRRAEQLEGVFVRIYDFFIGAPDSAANAMGYWRVKDRGEGSAWFNTNGLTGQDIIEIGLDEDYLEENMHFYWMEGVFTENWGRYAIAPLDANSVTVGVENDDANSPFSFTLDEAYPNPFNSSTRISFELSKQGWTKLALYDLAGREVATLLEGEMTPGRYSQVLDASSMANGVYILQLKTDVRTVSRKVVLVK
jgi:hypothetical protein